MPVPGPPDALWAAALLAWALYAAVLGEAVRLVAARWVPQWRSSEPIERFLLDFYLGGATWYLLAALPVGGFVRPVVFGLPIAAASGLLVVTVLRRRAGHRPPVEQTIGRLFAWAPALAVATALGLFLVEIAAALSVGTGNTFDSSLLTTYTALLLQHGSLPLSFRPYASPMILYPQGTTVWLGGAQLAFGLPPARTALLVTPLFLALVPLSGYVFGRRLFGTDRAGAAVALSLGWLGPATRALVGGSNDFALAFPLVLLLAAQTTAWTGDRSLRWGDAAGFGLLLGYSAAINPVGAEWLLPALLTMLLVRSLPDRARAARAIRRWAVALGAAYVPLLPTIYVLALGIRSPGLVAGAASPPSLARTGISVSQLVGSLDPFLFRATDLELSPLPTIRAELAILLVVGIVLLLVARRPAGRGPDGSAFATWALAAGGAIVAWMIVLTAAGAGVAVARPFAEISSAAELSMWIFTVYGLIAAVPLLWLFDLLASPPRPSVSGAATPASRYRRARTVGRSGPERGAALLFVAAVAVLAPGIVLTSTSLSPVLRTFYSDFGTVSGADFALLACAGGHLPPASRVLVAPGSAAEFLPGYARGIVLLYPLVPEWQWESAAYRLVVQQLTNATLNASGESALASLNVGFIAVTERNTVLWPPFSPTPLESSEFSVVFHEADAYMFSMNASATPFPCG
ncbi:MAG: hypothetical protein WAK40_06470 [Thermoplasmata archaeon]